MKAKPTKAELAKINKVLKKVNLGPRIPMNLLKTPKNNSEIEEEPMGGAAKPLSFHPLDLESALSSLLKVKPPAKD